MHMYVSNETFVRNVAHGKTLPVIFTSIAKFFKRGSNASSPFLSGHSQSSPPAVVQPPLKNAEEMAALTKSIKDQMTALAVRVCGRLPTLAPLLRCLEDATFDITYDNIEYLINERTEGAEKHNFLRTLITDLDHCSASKNGDELNKALAMATLQKEVCDLPLKSYGNLNRQQHGELFNSEEMKKRFKEEITEILKNLQTTWNFAAADAD
ncbi:hypothetical protein [Sodalis sp. dw_96]|uniref:hypothetical protein n=1 Tax=Sodalis sp. dw_96 TaxID=2719794 RepID=UPI001BD2D8C8|nr:hypothetical protein [Sodalis sp. dw_96]